MTKSPDHDPETHRGSRVARSLTAPLPERWRPFSAFLGGIIILAILTIVGRYNSDAWRFFAGFTAVAAVIGVTWTLVRSRRASTVG